MVQGRLVGYPIIDLKPDRCDVHRYVRDLEDVLIRAAGELGVEAARVDGLTGVWVGREKAGRDRRAHFALGDEPRFRVERDHQPRVFQTDRARAASPIEASLRSPDCLDSLVDRRVVEDGIVAHFCEVFERTAAHAAPVGEPS